jgi:hypothetical protein
MATAREQTLIDIIFQMGMTIKNDPAFDEMSNEELASWISIQLEGCGFPTTPCGASWGVLERE